jgi:hypothetical protein
MTFGRMEFDLVATPGTVGGGDAPVTARAAGHDVALLGVSAAWGAVLGFGVAGMVGLAREQRPAWGTGAGIGAAGGAAVALGAMVVAR